MESSNTSVNELITALCEKFASKQNRYSISKCKKKLKFKAFEVLIYKNFSLKVEEDFMNDSYYKIISWIFIIKHEYNQEKMANELQASLDCLQMSDQIDTKLRENVLSFLFDLRKVPPNKRIENSVFTLPKCDELPWCTYTDNDFKLPTSNYEYREFHHNLFKLNKKDQDKFLLMSSNGLRSNVCNTSANEKLNNSISLNFEDIWEDIHLVPINKKRSWESVETFDFFESVTFITELNSNYNLNLSLTHNAKKLTYVSLDTFIKDLKYLMVGIPSKIFLFNNVNKFSLAPVIIEGLDHETLNTFSESFLSCGDKYLILENLSSENGKMQKFWQMCIICKEFRESIRRYLSYYKVAIFSISNKYPINHISLIAKEMLSHLNILTEICENVLLNQSKKFNGVNILNYVYNLVLRSSNISLSKLLLSILYPCCQVYFSRFLQPWLFDGVLNDPYNEFFINCVPTNVVKKERKYWTKSYIINKSIVPVFLTSIQNKILLCGKSVQLMKICLPNSPMYRDLISCRPILTCCLTPEKLQDLIQKTNMYKLLTNDKCGTIFSFFNVINRSKENKEKFLTMVNYKRMVTLKRIELERVNKMKQENDKKEKELNLLREQYYEALQEKRMQALTEMAKEIKANEIELKMNALKEKIIEKEAINLIKYYDTLMEESDSRARIAEAHISRLKNIKLNLEKQSDPQIAEDIKTSLPEEELYVEEEIDEIPPPEQDNNENLNENIIEVEEESELDIVNANISNSQEVSKTDTVLNNFEIARRNKARVMSAELGIWNDEPPTETKKLSYNINNLTEAQKNKLKVMSTEFHIDYEGNKLAGGDTFDVNKTLITTKDLSSLEKNKKKVMSVSENLNRKNICDEIEINEKNKNENNRHNDLKLDFKHLRTAPMFNQFLKTPNFEFGKLSPMSIDSTPLSELTPISKINFFEINSATISTANTNFSEDGFNFDISENLNNNQNFQINNNDFVNSYTTQNFSKRASMEEVKETSLNRLNFYLQQSVIIPLHTQSNLVNNELLRYYNHNLNYLKVVSTLRDYFFLMDGEFGRNITESLFEKLYNVNNPIELLNFGTLQLIMNNSVYSSIHFEETSELLSFKINNIPKRFDLRDPNVLNCLSLTYNVGWPLNILLPADTFEKYNDIFKFLMKLHRVSWILKKIFIDLKMLSKQLGQRASFLAISPHYQSIHRFRHLMTQFVQAFQNYIVGDVLQTSWELFKKSLLSANNLDNVYELHTVYIKNILFMCLLNQKSMPINEAIHKIFVLMFKFYDYLRSRAWIFEDGVYIHPNFNKLEDIFNNFKEFVIYLFRVIKTAAKSGYQKDLYQLLTTLDLNNYYSKIINSDNN